MVPHHSLQTVPSIIVGHMLQSAAKGRGLTPRATLQCRSTNECTTLKNPFLGGGGAFRACTYTLNMAVSLLQTCHMRNLTSLPDFRRYKDDRHYYEAPGRFPLNTAYTEVVQALCSGILVLGNNRPTQAINIIKRFLNN